MTTNTPYLKKPYYNSEQIDPNKQLAILSQYLLNSTDGKYSNIELEVKFGTKGSNQITQMDYDNVIKKLKSLNFSTASDGGFYSLKIQPETLDIKTGEFKSSDDVDKFRVEIKGIKLIQEYCRTNNLPELVSTNGAEIEIMRKNNIIINNTILKSAEFDDFNFRVSCKNEEIIGKSSKIGQDLLSKWNKAKKMFRYINRVSFTNEKYPFKIELSIIRSSLKEKWHYIKTYNISDSNVFNNPETYEIEIEVINDLAQQMYKTKEALTSALHNIIKIVLGAIQHSEYPISYVEQERILVEYMKLLHGLKYEVTKKVYSNNFIGPNPKTLQIKHIVQTNIDTNIPNITVPYTYCVTDKADGSRNLMLINNVGKIYLINMNMNVVYTGIKINNEDLFNSLLDGELITHNKNGKFINTYAAFDIYYKSTVDVRMLPFMIVPLKELIEKKYKDKSRLDFLKELINDLSVISASFNKNSRVAFPMNIVSKKFYPSYMQELNEDIVNVNSIFQACNYIIQRINSGLYEYNTDGLIFTPTILGVGSNKCLEASALKKVTWDHAFKWKPPIFNTIDFLVTTIKSPDGKDAIKSQFVNGFNAYDNVQFNQYKMLQLRVGFNEKRDGYINPCQDVLDDNIPTNAGDSDYEIKPVQFFPTEPSDPQGGLANIMLELDGNNNYQMFTEERQVFTDETIVEFKYDFSKKGLWSWIPLRLRYDKTLEYKQGMKNFGNAYKTANDNWYSIHNPITEYMISTGNDIPNKLISDDVYYNNTSSEKLSGSMRDFHNIFVKQKLIQSVSTSGNTLIDYACGKGGDFPKWISAKLSFVFGIDISKDNLENRLNGACARFLNFKRDFKQMPYAIFVNGNSSLNIRSGKAMLNEKAALITKTIFGNNVKDERLGVAVARQFGKATDGFNISSCQFAIHYMFESNETFYNFIQNLAECTKLNGYVVGTCYDGSTVFDLLKSKNKDESVDIYDGDKKVWEMSKQYSSSTFENNETSLGYKINVYQDTINQTLTEYLVNFTFLTQIMEDYGFEVLRKEEAVINGMPDGSGMFVELFNLMTEEIKRNPNKLKDYKNAQNMSPLEKRISYLNRYFIFKKIRTVNAENLTNNFLSKRALETEYENETTLQVQMQIQAINKKKPLIKKLNKKILLVQEELSA